MVDPGGCAQSSVPDRVDVPAVLSAGRDAPLPTACAKVESGFRPIGWDLRILTSSLKQAAERWNARSTL